MIPTTGIQEVFLDVRSMERMVHFYHDLLGLEIQYPRNMRSYAAEKSVTLDAQGIYLTLRAGGSTPGARTANPRIVFGVRDLTAARLYLEGRGVAVSDIRSLSEGVDLCDFTDPEGNTLALSFRHAVMVVPEYR